MPCLYADTPYLGEILSVLPKMPNHNWLISDLDCFDHCGWDGCEKMGRTKPVLTDAELRRDVGLRNMQCIWSVFSDIPVQRLESLQTGMIPSPSLPVFRRGGRSYPMVNVPLSLPSITNSKKLALLTAAR